MCGLQLQVKPHHPQQRATSLPLKCWSSTAHPPKLPGLGSRPPLSPPARPPSLPPAPWKPSEKAEAAFAKGDCPGHAAGCVELIREVSNALLRVAHAEDAVSAAAAKPAATSVFPGDEISEQIGCERYRASPLCSPQHPALLCHMDGRKIVLVFFL